MPPPNEPRTLFVYYKVPSEDRGAALAAVATLRERIAAALPHIHLECMQRPAIANGVETWMEIYRSDVGISEEGAQRIEAAVSQIPTLARWPRAREIFIPLRAT